jgi:hypothetical protein
MKPNPIVQSFFLSGFLGSKVDGISFMQAHPLDPDTLIHVQPSDPPISQPKSARAPLSATQRNGRKRPAFTAEEARHHFAIEALDKSGPFRSQPYLYTCVRCKWIFRINDSRGSVIALDGLGRHLPEPENAKRVLTFHRGPCPAFPILEYTVAETQLENSFRAYVSRLIDAIRSLRQSVRYPGTRTMSNT